MLTEYHALKNLVYRPLIPSNWCTSLSAEDFDILMHQMVSLDHWVRKLIGDVTNPNHWIDTTFPI